MERTCKGLFCQPCDKVINSRNSINGKCLACHHEVFLENIAEQFPEGEDIAVRKMAKIRETIREMRKLLSEAAAKNPEYGKMKKVDIIRAIRIDCNEFIRELMVENFRNVL